MNVTRAIGVTVAALSLVVLAGCGWTTDTAQAKAKADVFTQAILASGLAPAMTPEIARSLYGETGGDVCAALAHREQSPALVGWARTNLRGQPQKQAQHVIEYDRIVVQTYCPEHAARFNSLTADLGYTPPS